MKTNNFNFKFLFTFCLALMCMCMCIPMKSHAEEKKYNYSFTFILEDKKYDLVYSSDTPCVLFWSSASTDEHGMQLVSNTTNSGYYLKMYQLNADGLTCKEVNPLIDKIYNYDSSCGDFALDIDYVSCSASYYRFNIYNGYLDLKDSGLKLMIVPSNNSFKDSIIAEYLRSGKISSDVDSEGVYVVSDTTVLPRLDIYDGKIREPSSSSLAISDAVISSSGLITYKCTSPLSDSLYYGVVIVARARSERSYVYNYPLKYGYAIQTHFNDASFTQLGSGKFSQLSLVPYCISSNGNVIVGKSCSLAIDSTAFYYTKDDVNPRLFTTASKSLLPVSESPKGDDDFADSSHGGGGLRHDTGDIFFTGKTLIISGEKREVEKTVDRNDLYLKDVKVSSGVGNFSKTVKWSGTSIDGTLASIPSSDAIVVITYGMYDEDLNYKLYTLGTVNISKGKFTFNYKDFINDMSSSYTWDGDIRLCPVYYSESNKYLYLGRQTVVDLLHGGISEAYEDDDGKFQQDIIRNDNNTTDDIYNSDSFEWDTVSSDSLWNTVANFASGLDGVPSLINSLFAFLPEWVLGLIGLSIGALVVLRFLGR